jgi:hypothetical protein
VLAPRTEYPVARPLRVYAFDPSKGRNLNNYMTLQVPYEDKLKPGPVGKYIAVIDYDASNDAYYQAVDLDSREVLIRGGLEPSESDPRFHQQMAYAVVSETIGRFEFALGRNVRWRPPAGRHRGPYRDLLRVFPHAFQGANAFYDKDLRALLFGYFAAGSTDVGANLPGQTVFTCLSHDIVVHETTHALVDGLRDKFTEPTHLDTPAFHEAFADIVALFQHFSFQEALLDTINRTGGLLYRSELKSDVEKAEEKASIQSEEAPPNPLVELARQFGEAIGMRKALREALGTRPGTRALDTTFEPHERGSILVAAVFDAFFSIYLKRTRDLMRIARSGGGNAGPDLHPDLAARLAKEAASVAGNFVNICVRALDYCPPIDIRYGEFLRAVITADHDLVQDDPWDYRAALIEAFRSRGVVPEDVVSYSEEALLWMPPEAPVPPCEGLDFDLLGARAMASQSRNAVLLHRYAVENAERLGLSAKLPIQPHSFHAIHRISPNGILVFDFVVEFLQQREELIDPADSKGPTFLYRGGTTVLFNQEGKVRYSIRKRIDNTRRLAEERDYHRRSASLSAMAPFVDRPGQGGTSLAEIHRGY